MKVKIYDTKESESSLSQEVEPEEVKESLQEAEFKINAELLDNPETSKLRVINNLS